MIAVSFVIVSWNVKGLLGDLLESIRNTKSERFQIEIIVVDNCSADGTSAMVREQFPEVRLVESETNLGFARANNVGFTLAQGDYIFILNPDTKFENDSWHRLVFSLAEDESVGMVGPKIFYGDGRIQNSCCRKRMNLMPIFWFECLGIDKVPYLGKWLPKSRFFYYDALRSRDVEAISGAAMLVKKDLLMKVGGFDESYYHGGEDLHLCDEVLSSGKLIRYVSEAELVHYQGQSGKQTPVRSLINMSLSNEIYFRKRLGGFYAALYRAMMRFFHGHVAGIRILLVQLLRIKTREALKFRSELAKAYRTWKPIL